MRAPARIKPWPAPGRRLAANASAMLLAQAAHGLTAHLRGLLHVEIAPRALEPRLIEPAWLEPLLDACVVQGWRAEYGEVATVLDAASAQACAGAALGAADAAHGGPLSPLEREVACAVVKGALPALRPLCGEIRGSADVAPAAGDLFVEFALGPLPAASLALVLRPAPMLPGPPLDVESLAEVPMTLSVELARGGIALGELAGLGVGDVLVLDTQVGDDAVLKVGGESAFAGEAGVKGGRAAFAVRGALGRKVE
ncbi:FliM/FliN family flagellar motor switch protein [bacterium]|nr:MAG: FliM/FliN family flagellar motor switch protein [bacterium]